MKNRSVHGVLVSGAVGVVSLFGLVSNANAVPSFARQTGMTCAACHTVFPQLTPFGREFKMNGYTMAGEAYGGKTHNEKLSEDVMAPLSAMIQVSDTMVKKAPAGTQNSNAQFPEQLSLFYAGRISDHMGAFTQITYEAASDHFTMDNADIRWANSTTTSGGMPLTWGISLNNAPTAQDPWNSTPIWGFPFMGGAGGDSNVMLMQDGALNQSTAGLSAYVHVNNLVYGEVGFYRAAQLGFQDAGPGNSGSQYIVKDNAPYVRVAINKDWGDQNLMIGALKMTARMVPNTSTTSSALGVSDKYDDTGIDGQYQYLKGDNTLTVDTSYIDEKQTLDASQNGKTAKLHTFKLNGTYYYKRTIGGSLGYLTTGGDSNQVTATTGDNTGNTGAKPDTTAWTAEVNYLPWLNTKLGLQYVSYDKLNGTSTNASDSNTWYANAWFMF